MRTRGENMVCDITNSLTSKSRWQISDTSRIKIEPNIKTIKHESRWIWVHRVLSIHKKHACDAELCFLFENSKSSRLRAGAVNYHMSSVKRICIFEHSVMTNCNCACPAIQRGQGSGILSEASSWLTACMSEQRRFWRDCADAQARLNLHCSYRR